MPITSMGKKKNGVLQYRVRVNYTDANGNYKRLQKFVYGRAEAVLLERQLMEQSGSQADTPKFLTVSELISEYLENHKSEVRETTLKKSAQMLEHGVSVLIGDIRIDKLTTKVLQKWKADVSAMDKAVKTKQNYYKEFHAMLNYAVKHGYFERNPLNQIGTFKDAYDENIAEKLHYYTPDQFSAYIAAARQSAESADTLSEWGFYIFFMIAFYTGMRKGEIHALRWDDIEGNVIHVRHSICQKLQGDDRETPPKNKSSYRTLQIPIPLAEALTGHRRRWEAVEGFRTDLYVCGGLQALRDSSVEHHNQKYAKTAGLPHIRIHDFRHSHASVLCNAGINIQEIARRLGHANVQMTWNIYSHLYPHEEERAVSVLDKIK